MKAFRLFLVLTLASAPIIALPAFAQEPAPEASPAEATAELKPELLPNQKAFLNLPEERRKQFAKHLGEAMRLFQQKRIFETLSELDKADQIFDQSPEVLNVRGSCYVELRAFDKALDAFQAALKLTPDNPSIEFNIAEVHFVTKQWEKAHELFEKLFAEIPPENQALGRLVEFKLLLCKLKLDRRDEAVILSEKYDFLDDSPYYYYAKAALAYEQDDKRAAEEWIGRANRIFRNPAILAPWQDTLIEFGYIKSFYGDDTGSES